jgi:hypothetical protein
MILTKIEPFEKYALEYDEWFENNRYVYESELRAVREQLPQKGEGTEEGITVVSHLKKAGFKNLSFRQTLFQSSQRIKNIEPSKRGYGEGSFVVVKALKSMDLIPD